MVCEHFALLRHLRHHLSCVHGLLYGGGGASKIRAQSKMLANHRTDSRTSSPKQWGGRASTGSRLITRIIRCEPVLAWHPLLWGIISMEIDLLRVVCGHFAWSIMNWNWYFIHFNNNCFDLNETLQTISFNSKTQAHEHAKCSHTTPRIATCSVRVRYFKPRCTTAAGGSASTVSPVTTHVYSAPKKIGKQAEGNSKMHFKIANSCFCILLEKRTTRCWKTACSRPASSLDVTISHGTG